MFEFSIFLQVFTWGHRLVTPKRVVVSRNLKKSGSTPLKFHRKERLNVVSIAAGMVHSMALTDDGALFYWVSSDPDLRCQQVLILCTFLFTLFSDFPGTNMLIRNTFPLFVQIFFISYILCVEEIW